MCPPPPIIDLPRPLVQEVTLSAQNNPGITSKSGELKAGCWDTQYWLIGWVVRKSEITGTVEATNPQVMTTRHSQKKLRPERLPKNFEQFQTCHFPLKFTKINEKCGNFTFFPQN